MVIMTDIQKTVADLIEKSGVAFVGSIDARGTPNIKAMLPPRKMVGAKRFYFSTNTSSQRVIQFKENPKACLYFCDSLFFRGVMLTGTMEVLEDCQSKEMIWRDGDTLYYHLGVADPDYCVLRFTASNGRFYSNFKSENFKVK
jgi:general stress protein 26